MTTNLVGLNLQNTLKTPMSFARYHPRLLTDKLVRTIRCEIARRLGRKNSLPLPNSADMTAKKADQPTLPLHGEDELARLPILGFLAKKQTVVKQLLRRIDSFHPHATLVHLSVAYAIAAPFTFVAGSSTAERSLTK